MPYRDFQCSLSGCSRSLAVDACRETLDPKTIDRYAIGETECECWNRLWKASSSDPEVDGEEWVTFMERIQEHFRANYENFPDEFYFWNDFSGDRTLDMKIARPAVLTRRLLPDLQEYLQTHGQKMWRIRIPIYFKPNDPHRVIVLYPDAIDIPPLCPAAVVETRCNCYPLGSGTLRDIRDVARVSPLVAEPQAVVVRDSSD